MATGLEMYYRVKNAGKDLPKGVIRINEMCRLDLMKLRASDLESDGFLGVNADKSVSALLERKDLSVLGRFMGLKLVYDRDAPDIA